MLDEWVFHIWKLFWMMEGNLKVVDDSETVIYSTRIVFLVCAIVTNEAE